MFKILMTTLLCTFLGSFFAFFLNISRSDNAIFAAIMVFGCIIVPTFIAVLLFQLIKKRIRSNSILLTILLEIVSLLLLLIVGIFIWVLIDVMFLDFSWQSMKEDYKSQFAGFMVIGVFISFVLPLIDLGLDKWLHRGNVNQPD